VWRVNIRQCFIFFVAVRSCSRSSYLLSFIDIFAINSLLFWPTLYTCRPTCWVRHFATRLLPAFGSCWQRIASWIGREGGSYDSREAFVNQGRQSASLAEPVFSSCAVTNDRRVPVLALTELRSPTLHRPTRRNGRRRTLRVITWSQWRACVCAWVCVLVDV